METRALTQVLFGIAVMLFSLVMAATLPQILPGVGPVFPALALLAAVVGLIVAYRGYNETRVTPTNP